MPIITVDLLDECLAETTSWPAAEPACLPRWLRLHCCYRRGDAALDRAKNALAFQNVHQSKRIGGMRLTLREKISLIASLIRNLVLPFPLWNARLKLQAT